MTVTRRDGETPVLMSQREADGRARLLHFAAQLIIVPLDDRGILAERMNQNLPWCLPCRLLIASPVRKSLSMLLGPHSPPTSFNCRSRS